MLIEQMSLPLQKALTTNAGQSSTNPSYWVGTILDISATDPTGVGVFPVTANDDQTGAVFTQICILPYAEGYAGAEFWMRVYGWRRLGRDTTAKVWVPLILAETVCIVCDRPGPSGVSRLIQESERFCDQIGLTGGSAGVYSPGNQTVGYMTVPLLGCQMIQFDFFIGDELPAFPNALWSKL